MKNLLYHLTMLFNALGFLFSLSLVFYINLNHILFLPIIAISCFIFSISFALTAADFRHTKNLTRIKKLSHYVPDNSKVVIDYKDYFTSQKSDFIIG